MTVVVLLDECAREPSRRNWIPEPSVVLAAAPHGDDPPTADAEAGALFERWPDNGRVEQRVVSLARSGDVRHVAAPCEHDRRRAALLRDFLGLPGQGIEEFGVLSDVVVQRRLASRAGLLVPCHAPVDDVESLFAFLRHNPYPVAIAARDGFTDRVVVRAADELDAWIVALTAWIDDPLGLLVEEEAPATVYVVDGLLADGIFTTVSTGELVPVPADESGDVTDPSLVTRPLSAGADREAITATAAAAVRHVARLTGYRGLRVELRPGPGDKLVFGSLRHWSSTWPAAGTAREDGLARRRLEARSEAGLPLEPDAGEAYATTTRLA